MNRKRAYGVALALLLLAVVAVLFGTTTPGRMKSRSVVQFPERTQRNIMPEGKSDVPGVILTGYLKRNTESGPEYAILTVHNNTDRPIDAYQIAPVGYGARPVQTGGATTRFSISTDARDQEQPDGTTFSLDPPKPAIPPHGTDELAFPLNNVPDGAQLAVTAVVWHDGTTAGRHAEELRWKRANKAAGHGFPAELNNLKAQHNEQ
ncbi:MAG TPA: hypothetical protein VF546_10195 [Pyrinomonadaceae bacterium]|jgi:hypothetical protein